MKRLILFGLAALVLIAGLSCNGHSTSLMGYYQIGLEEPRFLHSTTRITLMNSSGKDFIGGSNETLTVYTIFFDDEETFIACLEHRLTPDDMVVINVEDELRGLSAGIPAEGVFISVAYDSTRKISRRLAGFQRHDLWFRDELKMSTETDLFVVPADSDIDRIVKLAANQ